MADVKKFIKGVVDLPSHLKEAVESAHAPKVFYSTAGRLADKISEANPKMSEYDVMKRAFDQSTKKLDWERVDKPALEKTYGDLGGSTFTDSKVKRMRNTPEVVEERKRKANEFLDQPTEPWVPPKPELQAFDRSSIKDALEGFPDVPQSVFPRDIPPRASTKHVDELYTDPANRELIKKQIMRGLPLGGESFYASLYPVKQAVLEAGMPASKFDSWVHSMAPASARNSIMNEMAVGQFLRNLHSQGIPLTAENVKREMAAFKEQFGIGLPLFDGHRLGVANVLENNLNLRDLSQANIPTNYKIPTYGAQKTGDFAHSATLDVHEAAGQTQGSRSHPYFTEAGGFGNTEYNAGEQGFLGIAKELGLPGGMAQAGRWFGGGELTGLKSPRGDALDLLEKQFAFSLLHQGRQPNPANIRSEVLKQIETGEGTLLPWYRKEGMPDVRTTGLQRKDGGQVEHMQAGGIKKGFNAIDEIINAAKNTTRIAPETEVADLLGRVANSAGMKAPVTANKPLTGLQDFHTSLGDRVRERVREKQDLADSMTFRYQPNQFVHSQHTLDKNLPPHRILNPMPFRRMVMREDKPFLGMKGEDGKQMYHPYEPGYRIRHDISPDEWHEYQLPESALIKPVDDFAEGGAVHMQHGGIMPRAGIYYPTSSDERNQAAGLPADFYRKGMTDVASHGYHAGVDVPAGDARLTADLMGSRYVSPQMTRDAINALRLGAEFPVGEGRLRAEVMKGLTPNVPTNFGLRYSRPFAEGGSVEHMQAGGLKTLMGEVLNKGGTYAARRLERAADEIPNLEKLFQEQTLQRAFIGDNDRALMTMRPSEFENYAEPLLDLSKKSRANIANLKEIQGRDGFSNMPFLMINKEGKGSLDLPWITAHEGRHRSRAMDAAGEQASLVQLFPRTGLRESFPRGSEQEYIEALRKEMALTGNKVLPEKYYESVKDPSGRIVETRDIQRPAIDLPDLYAEGGAVHLQMGGMTPEPAGGSARQETFAAQHMEEGGDIMRRLFDHALDKGDIHEMTHAMLVKQHEAEYG